MKGVFLMEETKQQQAETKTAQNPSQEQEEPKKEQTLEEQLAFWKKTSRDWEDKCKANKRDLTKLQQQSEGQLSESEKLQRRVETLEKDCAEKNRLITVAEQAKAYGVDSSVLSRMNGSSEEEISANAKVLKDAMDAQGKFSSTPDGGEVKAATVSKQEILKIEDDKERLQAIKEHIDLF